VKFEVGIRLELRGPVSGHRKYNRAKVIGQAGPSRINQTQAKLRERSRTANGKNLSWMGVLGSNKETGEEARLREGKDATTKQKVSPHREASFQENRGGTIIHHREKNFAQDGTQAQYKEENFH